MFSGPIAAAAYAEMKKSADKKKATMKKEEDTTKKEEPVFQCTVCSALFNRKFNRDRHMELIHKIQRPDGPPLYPNVIKKVEEPQPIETENSADDQSEDSNQNQSEDSMQMNIETEPVKDFEKPSVEAKKPEKEYSHPTRISPSSGRIVKKAKRVIPVDAAAKKQEEDAKMEMCADDSIPSTDPKVIQLPLQAAARGNTLTPTMTVHFCGSCNYANKHRYIMLANGHALVMVPICERCNELNLTLSKTVQEFQKKHNCCKKH